MLCFHQYHLLKLKKLTHDDQNHELILRSVEQVLGYDLLSHFPLLVLSVHHQILYRNSFSRTKIFLLAKRKTIDNRTQKPVGDNLMLDEFPP